MYGQNWAVEPVRSWFTESRRIASWLEILAAIAQAQADLGAVPRAAADDIERVCTSERFDLDRLAERSHATGTRLPACSRRSATWWAPATPATSAWA
jgi:adenylosuccinate lyase